MSECPVVKASAKRKPWNRNGLAENCAKRIADLERQLAEARKALASLVRDIDDETDGEGLPCCQADTWDMCLRVLEEGKK